MLVSVVLSVCMCVCVGGGEDNININHAQNTKRILVNFSYHRRKALSRGVG